MIYLTTFRSMTTPTLLPSKTAFVNLTIVSIAWHGDMVMTDNILNIETVYEQIIQ